MRSVLGLLVRFGCAVFFPFCNNGRHIKVSEYQTAMSGGYSYSKEQMIGLAIGFMILPTVFYGLRVWARLLIHRVTLDDYLSGAALVSCPRRTVFTGSPLVDLLARLLLASAIRYKIKLACGDRH